MKIITQNRRARHEYLILDAIEAGIELKGTEVKSLRQGKANLKDSYARVEKGQVQLYNMHISAYEQGGVHNHDPERVRKLLLHKYEIKKLIGRVQERGLTLVPLKVYFNSSGKAKVELALAKGKRVFDKREDMARKAAQMEIERGLKASRQGHRSCLP